MTVSSAASITARAYPYRVRGTRSDQHPVRIAARGARRTRRRADDASAVDVSIRIDAVTVFLPLNP